MKAACVTINIWSDDDLPDDLPEALALHMEYISGLCERGFLAGQIVDDRFNGWWEIREGQAAVKVEVPKSRRRRPVSVPPV